MKRIHGFSTVMPASAAAAAVMATSSTATSSTLRDGTIARSIDLIQCRGRWSSHGRLLCCYLCRLPEARTSIASSGETAVRVNVAPSLERVPAGTPSKSTLNSCLVDSLPGRGRTGSGGGKAHAGVGPSTKRSTGVPSGALTSIMTRSRPSTTLRRTEAQWGFRQATRGAERAPPPRRAPALRRHRFRRA